MLSRNEAILCYAGHRNVGQTAHEVLGHVGWCAVFLGWSGWNCAHPKVSSRKPRSDLIERWVGDIDQSASIKVSLRAKLRDFIIRVRRNYRTPTIRYMVR